MLLRLVAIGNNQLAGRKGKFLRLNEMSSFMFCTRPVQIAFSSPGIKKKVQTCRVRKEKIFNYTLKKFIYNESYFVPSSGAGGIRT